jgi:hypothetical protein
LFSLMLVSAGGFPSKRPPFFNVPLFLFGA